MIQVHLLSHFRNLEALPIAHYRCLGLGLVMDKATLEGSIDYGIVSWSPSRPCEYFSKLILHQTQPYEVLFTWVLGDR
ncbi:hypothetical protein BDV97DRAFT_345428 [Delphinella strobiligena]|nr:hypothetical protein BDV97DRAFT_345428 [Delphinella strobiligena]